MTWHSLRADPVSKHPGHSHSASLSRAPGGGNNHECSHFTDKKTEALQTLSCPALLMPKLEGRGSFSQSNTKWNHTNQVLPQRTEPEAESYDSHLGPPGTVLGLSLLLSAPQDTPDPISTKRCSWLHSPRSFQRNRAKNYFGHFVE